MALVAETLDGLPDAAARSDVLMVLRHEPDSGEERGLLCDYLQEMWETVDLLIARFGVESARKIILAPSSSPVREIPLS